MKRSLASTSSDAKRRKVKHEGAKVVTKLKCRVCTKYKERIYHLGLHRQELVDWFRLKIMEGDIHSDQRIVGRKNFNDKWITSGADELRTWLIMASLTNTCMQ